MEHSKVSVVIPVYNMEQYLAETLDSVMSSNYPDFEVIVMDDGSTDGSLSLAKDYAKNYPRIHVFTQNNGGASSARNNAISKSQGSYILPVDADNTISDNYISEAAKVLENNPKVKLVSCEADFIGKKTGRWKFTPFSINLLCRRNLIDNCAMYRKVDWEKAGGYCEEILGREDWDFWLSLFETGGEFVRLPIIGLYYRVRPNSKRVQTRHLYKDIIDMLNARHKPLFYKELCGELHYQRTYSKAFNIVIGWFLPQNVHANTSDLNMKKLVYAANENDATKSFLKNEETIRYIAYEESRLHIPFTRIRNSIARKAFDSSNKFHLGYYEEQISPFLLNSFLIINTLEE